MIKSNPYHILFFLIFACQSYSQELKLFTIADFDLKGKVKKCTVSTDYGKEVFEFNEEGYLLKSITAYNEEDKDITTYRYNNGFLVEKRLESYKNNVLDKATSIANFYEIDTTKSKIIREQIISYDKEFLEQQEYIFGEEDRLFKIITSHENAIDETIIEYAIYKDEITKTFFINDVIDKSIRTSNQTAKSKEIQKTILIKEFLDGEPNKAIEKRFNKNDRLVYEEHFYTDKSKEGFVSKEIHFFEYDDGILKKETIKQGNAVSNKEFIFQFDDSEEKNWVKKIITPDNKYTTRNIEYYPNLTVEE